MPERFSISPVGEINPLTLSLWERVRVRDF